MKAKFFYLVTGTMFRYKNDETNLIQVHEIFKNDNPIIARENAFTYYQNYIDVFLESRGEVYDTHEKTVNVLQDFLNSHKDKSFRIGNEIIIDKLHVDFDKGLYICLVMSNSKTITLSGGGKVYLEIHPIHYIDNKFIDSKMNVLDALQFEYSLFTKYKYDIKNYKKEYKILGPNEKSKTISILTSPIDFNKILSD
jgi:hypothetical protein